MRSAKPEGRGFTLIELLVIVAVITIIAAILFPIFAQAREKARQARCLSNLRQISMAVMLYAQDYDDTYPRDLSRCGDGPAADPCSRWNPSHRLEAALRPYIKNTDVFACPSATTPPVIWDTDHGVCGWSGWGYPDFMCFPGDPARGKPLSYGWNSWLFQLCAFSPGGGCDAPGIAVAAIVSPSTRLMVADSRTPLTDPFVLSFANYPAATAFFAGNAGAFWPELAQNGGSGPEIVPAAHTRHQLGQNAAFLDGHVRWLPYQQFTGPSINDVAAKWFLYWQ